MFKVGDKVRVKNNITCLFLNGCGDRPEGCKGEMGVIERISPMSPFCNYQMYNVMFKAGSCSYQEKVLEKVFQSENEEIE